MTRSMPEVVRRCLLAAAVVLAVTAALGNFGHVYDHAQRDGRQGDGQALVAALTPDVLLILCVVKLRYAPRSVVAWSGLGVSVGFVVWSSVATAPTTFTGRAIAVWPVLVAVLAASLLEAKPEPAEDKPAAAREPEREPAPEPVREPEPRAVEPAAASLTASPGESVAALATRLASHPEDTWPSLADMTASGWGGKTRAQTIRRKARALQGSPRLVSVR